MALLHALLRAGWHPTVERRGKSTSVPRRYGDVRSAIVRGYKVKFKRGGQAMAVANVADEL